MNSLTVCLVLLSTMPGILGDCPAVQPPQGGIVRERVLEDGTVQTIYSCEPNRRLKGRKVVTCTTNGWDHPVPKCVPRDNVIRRDDLYLGDQSVVDGGELQISKGYLKNKMDELKKRKKAKDGKERKRKRKKPAREKSLSKFPARRLNETVVSQLDISCFAKTLGKRRIKAPSIEHAYVAKYARRKNVLPPYNRYLVAVYECADSYVFVDSTTDRLFCSNGTWLGRRPKCVRENQVSIEKVKRCDQGECEHVCEDTATGIKCSCFDGFRAKGSSCIDIDECAEGSTKCADICRNEPGSYSCECHRGFQLGTDGHSCQDINECLSNNGHGPCQGNCQNLVGGYECSCADIPGHKLAADNHTCEDIDECALNNANCSHSCFNTPGSVFCLCPDGFYLTDDLKTCQDIDECKTSKICTEDAECENTVGSYKCISKVHPNMVTKILREEDYDNENEDDNDDDSDYGEEITEVPSPHKCEDGFKRNENFECVDINECVESDSHGCQHECVNEPGRYRCTCHDGHKLAEDGATCEDVDECTDESRHTCSHICTNTIGGYTCECPLGFVLVDDNATCVEKPRSNCDSFKDLCSHVCEDSEDGPRCVCPTGYLLSDDRTSCSDVDECLEDEHDCSHECVNIPGSYKCACPRDMKLLEDGLTCGNSMCSEGLRRDDEDGECRDVDECLEGDHECSHLCLNEFGTYRCSCPSGWILEDDGLTCERSINPCSDSSCSHSCIATGSSYKCKCPAGYFLDADGNTCKDKDECEDEATNNCSHDCENLEGSYSCSCPAGFELGEDNRTCIVVIHDECTENNNCTCPTGYLYSYKERVCEDVDECQDEHKCSHDCVNTNGSYFCECPSGWRLQEDFRICRQLSDDPCTQDHGCSHTCEQNDGRIRCGCPEGYELQDDEKTCQDINECSDESHACSHACVNIEGAYRCECPSGFQLNNDSRNCKDIDECSSEEDTGCSHGCLNTNGAFNCTCPEGYELQDDGRTCEDINECMQYNGGCSHLCANTEGGVECACPDNYKLLKDDGRTCVEISACSIDNGGCSHFCRHENGRASCSCPPEMSLSEDKATCAYENGCLNENNGGCSHLCFYEDGNVTCACPAGMILTEDSRHCVREDRCKIDNGGCSHSCHDHEDGNVTCSCPEEMFLSQDNDTLCVHKNRCLIENGGCSDICIFEEGSIVCECPDGYRLSPRDNATCVDIDECLELRDNCTHQCLNTLGGFDCACNVGFTQNSQDPTLCDDINECENGHAGCSHSCVNLVGSFQCLCPAEHGLERNNKTCVLMDGCKRDNGNCSHYCHQKEDSNGVASISCSCPLGFQLKRDLRTCEDIDECEEFENDVESGCSHTCVNTEGGYYCECPAGYTLMPDDRNVCVDVDECLTDRHNCTHECVNLLGGYTCACREGHYLHVDESTCLDIDECRERNGECSHVCTNIVGGHFCSCPTGYELSQEDERTCVDVDECANDNGGCDRTTCVNTVGSFRCECLPGHVPRNGSCRPLDPCQDEGNGGCEQICVAVNGTAVCSCEKGFQKGGIDGTECHDINECERQHDCDHVCVNKPGSYECRCEEGFRMMNSTCVDVDECAAGICKGNKCTNMPGGYRCECETGYRFHNDTCVDIDECIERAPCNEKCVNTPGSYYCTCPLGFQLQGNECVDIDECEWHRDGCDQECINTVGSFICACRAGYALISRKQCQDVNECLNRNGGCTGECVNTAGSYYCTCSVDLVLAPDERTCVSQTSQRCHAMEPPLHGEIRCPGHPSGASVYPQGAKCHVRCRGGFRLEGAHMRHCVSDGRWNGKEPICLREVVTDSLYNPNTPRPFVSCPQDMNVELPARQNTVRVTFPQPKSNMNWWRYVHASPPWAKQLQADLPAGTTVVTFTAWSPVSNYTSTCRIVIRVRDTENPKVTMCPTSFEVRLSPGERNRLIFWQEPTFTDNVAVEHVYQTRGPGQVMYPGVHNVRYVASDAAGNRAECHFSIHVRESEEDHNSEPRFYRRKMLMCPGRPPQPVPSSSYNWQIPSGCYLRYTRIFSGAYQRHPERWQHGYQDAGASYREPPPVQQTQSRPDISVPYNNDRHSGRQHHPWRVQEQQLLHRQYRQRATRTDHVVSPPTHYGTGRVETRILPPPSSRHECCT